MAGLAGGLFARDTSRLLMPTQDELISRAKEQAAIAQAQSLTRQNEVETGLLPQAQAVKDLRARTEEEYRRAQAERIRLGQIPLDTARANQADAMTEIGIPSQANLRNIQGQDIQATQPGRIDERAARTANIEADTAYYDTKIAETQAKINEMRLQGVRTQAQAERIRMLMNIERRLLEVRARNMELEPELRIYETQAQHSGPQSVTAVDPAGNARVDREGRPINIRVPGTGLPTAPEIPGVETSVEDTLDLAELEQAGPQATLAEFQGLTAKYGGVLDDATMLPEDVAAFRVFKEYFAAHPEIRAGQPSAPAPIPARTPAAPVASPVQAPSAFQRYSSFFPETGRGGLRQTLPSRTPQANPGSLQQEMRDRVRGRNRLSGDVPRY